MDVQSHVVRDRVRKPRIDAFWGAFSQHPVRCGLYALGVGPGNARPGPCGLDGGILRG